MTNHLLVFAQYPVAIDPPTAPLAASSPNLDFRFVPTNPHATGPTPAGALALPPLLHSPGTNPLFAIRETHTGQLNGPMCSATLLLPDLHQPHTLVSTSLQLIILRLTTSHHRPHVP